MGGTGEGPHSTIAKITLVSPDPPVDGHPGLRYERLDQRFLASARGGAYPLKGKGPKSTTVYVLIVARSSKGLWSALV